MYAKDGKDISLLHILTISSLSYELRLFSICFGRMTLAVLNQCARIPENDKLLFKGKETNVKCVKDLCMDDACCTSFCRCSF